MTTSIAAVKSIGKRNLQRVAARAKDRGVSPARYLHDLIELEKAIEHDARTKSFREIVGPGEDVSEAEIDSLVRKIRAERR